MAYRLLDESPQELAPENLLQTGIRNVVRGSARGIESVLGLPGDIVKGASALGNLGIKKATGYAPLPSNAPIGSEAIREYGTNALEKYLLPENYLQPQGDYEKLFDDFVGDAASLLVPVGGANTVKRALAVSGLGNLASYSTKKLGGGEGAQAGAKVGTMLLTNLAGPASLKKYTSSLYKNADEAIKTNPKISAHALESTIDKLTKLDKRGDLPTSVSKHLNDLKENISPKSSGYKVSVNELWDFKKKLNEALSGEQLSKSAQHALPDAAKHFTGSLTHYGANKNRAFLDPFLKAEEIFSSVNSDKGISSWLNKNLSDKNLGYGATALLFGLGGKATAAGLAGAYGAREGAKLLSAVNKSPEIRSYYLRSLNAAAKKNPQLTLKYAQKLDSQIQKEFPDIGAPRYRLID